MKNVSERRRKPLSDLTNSKPQSLLSSSSSATNTIPCTVAPNVSEPISAFCSRIHTLNERKRNAKKAIENPKISTIRDKNDGVEHASLDLPNARVLAVRCRKKRHAVPDEKDPQLQDYIEKQKAYFKEIDEFELAEEEVESVHQLD